ncbi:MAG: amidophosphoribosyltransferase [Granulosicoccus sp.]
MCGIVGLYLKNEALRPRLGRWFRPMLSSMQSRGPDSAGVAVYRDPAPSGFTKYSIASDLPDIDWSALLNDLQAALQCQATHLPVDTHCIVTCNAEERAVRHWLAAAHPEIRLVGSGVNLEIFKEVGLPDDVFDRFDLDSASGTHMIGHTRMATESAVTTAGSHPFATGADLCLVHNGSLSNHNRLREKLKREGLTFQTDNDSEVAAAYMTWKINGGCSLQQTLEQAIDDLDGFYTFCVGTSHGFAVLRDPIACKHAVLAETDDWVAMATEYRAIATLPGSDNATIWEPKPQTVYAWGDVDQLSVAVA